MDDQLRPILHALAAPGATLEVTDLHEFGFLLPLCNVVGACWYDAPIDYAEFMALLDVGYIVKTRAFRQWKNIYGITVGGMEALAAVAPER